MEEQIPDKIIRKRSTLLEAKNSNAYRLVHGGGDGFKGFYLDRLGDYLLASKEGDLSPLEKQMTLAWMTRLGSRGAYFKQLERQVRKIEK